MRRTLRGIALREIAGTVPLRILEADANLAADRRRNRRDEDLVATRTQNRPDVVVPEQPVGGAPHVHHVLGMRPDATADTKHRLLPYHRFFQTAGARCSLRRATPSLAHDPE
jgi:hypothetical protein